MAIREELNKRNIYTELEPLYIKKVLGAMVAALDRQKSLGNYVLMYNFLREKALEELALAPKYTTLEPLVVPAAPVKIVIGLELVFSGL